MKIKLFGKPVTKERLFNMFWLWDARQSHGAGLIAQSRIIDVANFTAVGMILLVFPGIPKYMFPVILITYYLVTYWMGHKDETKWGYWAFSNNKDKTYVVNPYERRIEQRQIRIAKKLGIYQKGDDDVYENE